MPCEVLIIDVTDFAMLGKDFAESIIKFARSVPEDSELRRALIEMNRWNQYKWAVTKSIKAERYNTVRDFDKQLRHGWQVPMKQQEVSQKGIDETYIKSHGLNYKDGQLIKANYLTTYDFLMKQKKKKIEDVQQKQKLKSYLVGFE